MSNTGANGTKITWDDFQETVEAGEVGEYSVTIEVGDAGIAPGDNLDVHVSTFLYVAGENDTSIVSSDSFQTTENDTVITSLSHTFPTNNEIQNSVQSSSGSRFVSGGTRDSVVGNYPRSDYPVWMKAELRYGNTGGSADETVDTKNLGPSTNTSLPQVTEPSPDIQQGIIGEADSRSSEQTLRGAFSNQVTFAIRDIELEDDANFPRDERANLEPRASSGPKIVIDEYPNPTVSIDGAGRFAKHEIIGGATVRQKIGEDPLNISVNGVCEEKTANKIDALRDAKVGRMYSTRLPGSTDSEGDDDGGSMLVQFGSTSTEPITDGGAADFKTGELLYTYSINAIEVIQ
jgi:hypothetical protein